MIEFNPDGSIKIPEAMRKQKEEKDLRMKKGNCVTIQKEVVSFTAPKKCHLTLKLSEKITNDDFIPRIYGYFNENSQVPSKLTKNQDNECIVEIGSSFSRCRDCTNFVNRVRNHLDGNLIVNKGNCPYEDRRSSFCYEDHFE